MLRIEYLFCVKLCVIVFFSFIAWLVIPMTVKVEAFWIIVTITSQVAWWLGYRWATTLNHLSVSHFCMFVTCQSEWFQFSLRSIDWGSLFSLICSASAMWCFLKPIFMYVRERKHDVLLCIWPAPQCHVAGGVWCL